MTPTPTPTSPQPRSAARSASRRSLLAAICAVCALLPGLAATQASTAAAEDRYIVLINPNSNANTTRSMTEIASTATGGIKVEGKSNEGVPPLLTTPNDLADALPGVVKIGVEATQDPKVGAIIVSAFGDPGLPELRAKVGVPVFGIREQAFHEAAKGGRPFGIATTTPDPGLLEGFRQTAVALGYGAQFRGTRATPGDPNALMNKSPEELDAALAEAVRASAADGAKAVIIGGGPLTASALRLQPKFDMPLVVPVIAARAGCGRQHPQEQVGIHRPRSRRRHQRIWRIEQSRSTDLNSGSLGSGVVREPGLATKRPPTCCGTSGCGFSSNPSTPPVSLVACARSSVVHWRRAMVGFIGARLAPVRRHGPAQRSASGQSGAAFTGAYTPNGEGVCQRWQTPSFTSGGASGTRPSCRATNKKTL